MDWTRRAAGPVIPADLESRLLEIISLPVLNRVVNPRFDQTCRRKEATWECAERDSRKLRAILWAVHGFDWQKEKWDDEKLHLLWQYMAQRCLPGNCIVSESVYGC